MDMRSSPRPPHTYTIGYAIMPTTRDAFMQQPSFLELAARRGIRFVAIDVFSRPLAEQGPFDLVLHKVYEQPWRQQLEAFSALHPDVPLVDPHAAIDRVLERSTMLDVVASGLQVGVPRQIVVCDAASLDNDDVIGDLRFPVIAKPEEAWSHDLCLVYRREGLRGLHAPLVLQEFVNHGGVLFKVYVVGDHATCVRRNSLPDERLQNNGGADAAVRFGYISDGPPPAVAEDDVDPVKMPPADLINKVARELRRTLGLHLINFDLIRATDGNYFVIDINYCPSYSKVPGFEHVLTDFFWEMLNARIVRGQQQYDQISGQKVEARKTGLEPKTSVPWKEGYWARLTPGISAN